MANDNYYIIYVLLKNDWTNKKKERNYRFSSTLYSGDIDRNNENKIAKRKIVWIRTWRGKWFTNQLTYLLLLQISCIVFLASILVNVFGSPAPGNHHKVRIHVPVKHHTHVHTKTLVKTVHVPLPIKHHKDEEGLEWAFSKKSKKFKIKHRLWAQIPFACKHQKTWKIPLSQFLMSN